MKLHLTYAEAVAVISRQLLSSTHNGEPVEVVIGRKSEVKKAKSFSLTPVWPRFWSGPLNGLERLSVDFLKLNMGDGTPGRVQNFAEKIKCIKELRALTGMGLFESKTAIENWPDYLNACKRLDRWADVCRDGNGGFIYS